HSFTAKAFDAAGNSAISAPRVLTINIAASTGTGIAAAHPRDVGIASDPAVVFAENFEESSISTMTSRWEDIGNSANMSFNADIPANSSGTKSMLSNGSSYLFRRLLPGYDQLYIRYYAKLDPSCSEVHHFVWLGGYNPVLSYP